MKRETAAERPCQASGWQVGGLAARRDDNTACGRQIDVMVPRNLAPSALVLTVAAVLAACGSGNSPGASDSATDGTSGLDIGGGLQSQFESTVQAVLPSVVLIQTGTDLGSGVIFDRKGDIVTNAHVVGSAHTFTVEVTGSAHPRSAHLVGTYPPDDLAVIRVGDMSGLEPAQFADSSKVRVGEIVLVMGNPLGLASSVTKRHRFSGRAHGHRTDRRRIAGRNAAGHDPDQRRDQPRQQWWRAGQLLRRAHSTVSVPDM